MTYNNIDVEKYQIMLHMVNVYAKKHEGIKPQFKYDRNTQTLEIGGISKPITFQTNTLGDIPAGEYEVVGEAVTSKTADGKTDINGMQNYKKSIVNVSNYPEVFDFINMHRNSTNCACCGTKRERNDFFYIRRADDPNHNMYQVGSSCVDNYFDKSYFKLMGDLSNVADESDRTVVRGKTKDCNLISYISEYLYYRYKAESVTEAHKNAVAYSNGDKNIDPELKDDLKNSIERVLTYTRKYDVGEENKPALKTIQEMARMLNSDENTDPFYSAAHCKEIGKECENLFWTANIYHMVSNYSEKNPEYTINMDDIFPIKIDADTKEVTNKNGERMFSISKDSEADVCDACERYMDERIQPTRVQDKIAALQNDIDFEHPLIEKITIEPIDKYYGVPKDHAWLQITHTDEACKYYYHKTDSIEIDPTRQNNEDINRIIKDHMTTVENIYNSGKQAKVIEEHGMDVITKLLEEMHVETTDIYHESHGNYDGKAYIYFDIKFKDEYKCAIEMYPADKYADPTIAETYITKQFKDRYNAVKKERAEHIAAEKARVEAENARKKAFEDSQKKYRDEVNAACKTIDKSTNGELTRWLKVKDAKTKIYDGPCSLMFGHPDSGTYMEFRTGENHTLLRDGDNYKGHITIDGRRISSGDYITPSDVKVFVDTIDPSKPKPQINIQAKPAAEVAKNSILSSTKKAIDELNQSLNGRVEYVGYKDESKNAIVSLKITKNKDHIEGVRDIKVPKGLMHKPDILHSKIRAKIITEFGMLKSTSKGVTTIPDKVDNDFTATDDSKTNDNPDV